MTREESSLVKYWRREIEHLKEQQKYLKDKVIQSWLRKNIAELSARIIGANREKILKGDHRD